MSNVKFPMFYLYILYSKKDKKLYVGHTNDLRRRFKLHNSGKVPSTKNRRPLVLIYYEAYKARKEARKRELFLKSLWGGREKKKILENYLKGLKHPL